MRLDEFQFVLIDKESRNEIPGSLCGTIFVNNNDYFFDGFNPILDIEYVGKSIGRL